LKKFFRKNFSWFATLESTKSCLVGLTGLKYYGFALKSYPDGTNGPAEAAVHSSDCRTLAQDGASGHRVKRGKDTWKALPKLTPIEVIGKLPMVAEHDPEAVAQRAGLQLRCARQRLQHDLDRPGPRHCFRLALASKPRYGRHGAAHRRGRDGAVAPVRSRRKRAGDTILEPRSNADIDY
jgi:hypothetical protein